MPNTTSSGARVASSAETYTGLRLLMRKLEEKKSVSLIAH